LNEAINELIREAKVDRAIVLAKSRFKERETLEDFITLANALVSARRVRDLRSLLKQYPYFFRIRREYLAVLNLRTLDLDSLERTMVSVAAIVKGWVLATLGYVSEAERILPNLRSPSFLPSYVDIMAGRPPRFLKQFLPYSMNRIYVDYLRGMYLVAGGFWEEGSALLNETAFKAFEGGYVGWGIDMLNLAGFVALNPTMIEAGRQIARSLGDRLSQKVSEIYLIPFRRRIPKFPDVPRFREQATMAGALLSGAPLPLKDDDLFFYRAIWWYAHKRILDLPFLSLAGKPRLYQGRREIKLHRHRKAIAVLVFSKVLGDAGRDYAHVIFKDSINPRRRYIEYLGRLGNLRHIPMDLLITKKYGTFLRDCEEEWGLFLRRRVLSGL